MEDIQDVQSVALEVDVVQLEESFEKDEDLKDTSSLSRKVEEAKEVLPSPDFADLG